MLRGLPVDRERSWILLAASMILPPQTKSSHLPSHSAAPKQLYIVWNGACWSVAEVLVCGTLSHTALSHIGDFKEQL